MEIGLVFSGAMVALTIVFLVAFRRRARKAIQAADEGAPQFRLGAMAQQMGLTVVEGDPQINLVYALGVHRAKKIPVGITFDSHHTTTTRLRMAGQPDRPAHRARPLRRDALQVGGWHADSAPDGPQHDLRLPPRGAVARRVPAFEIVLRQEIRGLETEPRLGLPPQSFGSQDLDARVVLMSSDPCVGAALASVAFGMTQFESLHIVGSGAALCHVTGENASTTALYRLVEAQRLLYALSDVLTSAAPATGSPRPSPEGGQAHW